MSERERWEAAWFWRGRVAAVCRDAETHLELALAQCPASVERVKIRRALRETRSARQQAESGMATAMRKVEELGGSVLGS